MPTNKTIDNHYDVVIVGARCAGASTAMLLARAGVKVLLIDRQDYGTDTTSTHALMRGAVLLLNQWGLLPAVMAEDTPEVTRTTFHYGSEEISVNIKPEYGIEHLCAPRRTVLDRILVNAAIDAGVHVRHGASLSDLQFGLNNRVVGARVRTRNGDHVDVKANLVVGADGRQSTVARQVNARCYLRGTHASGYVYGYFTGLKDDGYHWYFENQVAAGIIPTNSHQHCVFVGVPRAQFGSSFRKDIQGGFLRTAEANSPELLKTLDKADLVGRLRGFGGAPGYLKQSHGRGWALVGDAGYFKDPLTAHGITDALRDAGLLARAILDGSEAALARYQSERDALSEALFTVTDEITSFDWNIDDLKDKHLQLNKAMKAETAALASLTPLMPLAA